MRITYYEHNSDLEVRGSERRFRILTPERLRAATHCAALHGPAIPTWSMKQHLALGHLAGVCGRVSSEFMLAYGKRTGHKGASRINTLRVRVYRLSIDPACTQSAS
jgi:hypothetical protein